MTGFRYRLLRLELAIFLYALFPLAWLLHPFLLQDRGWTICFFRTITDNPCLFCGLTRAFACAMHGDMVSASQYHRLWWLFALAILLIAGLSLYDAIGNKNSLGTLGKLLYLKGWAIIVVIILLTCVRRLL